MTPFEMQQKLIESEISATEINDVGNSGYANIHEIREKMYDIVNKLNQAHKQTLQLERCSK